MCRFVAYLGKPIIVDELLLKQHIDEMRGSGPPLTEEEWIPIPQNHFIAVDRDLEVHLSPMHH